MKTTLAVLSLLTFSLAPAFAAEHDAGKKAEKAPAPSEKAAAPADKKAAPEMDEAMKRMIEYGTPGPEHARLKPVAGAWSVKSRMWHKPGSEPESSTGSAHYEWILDGRLLQSHFKGDMGGMPFQGIGHNGYDKVRQEYFGTWMDSMSTGMAVTGIGKYDEKTNTITEMGSYADPMTMERKKPFRTEWILPSKDNPDVMTFSMYHKDGKTGPEFKTMEMVYTRTK
jgi:hypothetical protein